ncbi:unnamed protein product [Peronospora destructor]|uniref:CCHC-type domain-containing protein n=1 Tax=Peronospora destructor TaxID=86335 RepID=A0AAV0VHG4_9STRA|nr:unnamed protein product [Peronospora destructor]
MSLGPSGSSFLRDRMVQHGTEAKLPSIKTEPHLMIAPANVSNFGPEQMQAFFNAAMEKFMEEQKAKERSIIRGVNTPRKSEGRDYPDVEMKSMGSHYTGGSHHSRPSEYDPDDLQIDEPRRPAVATTGGGMTTQRIRVSAISDLKEFAGKEHVEDRAIDWMSKVKSAFLRDQAPDSEKCLLFGDLLTAPARNWHRQLSRSARNSWKVFSESFRVEYCGHGVSVGRQYYHARKRSDESPLEYLYRLNVAGMRAKIPLEEMLRAYQRGRARQGKAIMGSNKFRQKAAAPPTPVPSKPTRAVRAILMETASSKSESDLSGSEPDGDQRQIFVSAMSDHPKFSNDSPSRQTAADQTDRQDRNMSLKLCTHCGSTKHSDLGCWKRLTCQKCSRKGHPSDHCVFVCRACGELNDAGKCPMEEFYNMILKWYVPTKHAGMLPEKAEKMLN